MASQKLGRLVGHKFRRLHQAEPAGIVGGHALGLCAEQCCQPQACRLRQRIPRRHVEPRHRHAHDALHPDEREALGEPGPEIDRRDPLAFHHARHLLEDARNRRHGGREIAPEIGTAGDAFLGLEVDQQQRRLGDQPAAGAERVGHRHFDAHGTDSADGEERRDGTHG